MRALLANRITLLWIVLLAATLLSWAMGHMDLGAAAGRPGAVVLMLAFIKVRIVMLDFMEVRHAPVLLRVVVESWAVLMCLVLIFLL